MGSADLQQEGASDRSEPVMVGHVLVDLEERDMAHTFHPVPYPKCGADVDAHSR